MHVRAVIPLIALTLALSAGARADAVQDNGGNIDDARTQAAREVFLAAVEAVHRGDWLEARELYARSYALRPAGTTLYSLAVAQRETGDLVKALENFRAFLALEPNAQSLPFRDPAERAVKDLDRRIARLVIVVEPKRAEGVALQLDGATVKPDAERLANPGVHTIEAAAPGYHARVMSVRVAPGASEKLVVTLQPIASADRPQQPLPAEPGAPVAPLLALGLGSVVLAAGVTTGVVGVVFASEATTEDEAHDARRLAITGDVLAAAGGLAAGLGLAFLIAELVTEDAAESSRITPTATGVRISF